MSSFEYMRMNNFQCLYIIGWDCDLQIYVSRAGNSSIKIVDLCHSYFHIHCIYIFGKSTHYFSIVYFDMIYLTTRKRVYPYIFNAWPMFKRVED